MFNFRFLTILLLPFFFVFGQIKVELRSHGVPVTLNQWYAQPNGDSIYLNEFKFYLAVPSDSLVLVDLAEQASLHLPYFSLDDETVLLRIGMDSVMNTCGRLDGPYDPLLGMYWAWNTGYINLKIMGESSAVPTNSHEFEFHLGGYRFPFATAQTIQVDLPIVYPSEYELNEHETWVKQFEQKHGSACLFAK